MNYKYLVIFEREGESFGAFVPDLPGCVAVAKSKARVRKLIREAIAMHVEDMLARGIRLPKPTTEVEMVEAVPA